MEVSEADRTELLAWTRSPTITAGAALRARIVLRSGAGEGTSAIARGLGVSRPTVITWRERYRSGGVAALADAPRSGRPRTVDEAVIIARTLEPPPERLGVTHWSTRLLAAELGIGDASVARCWRQFCLKPWRRETFKFSTDPELEAKVKDMIGLYLDPPEKAVVLCVDEKSQIQALNRTARSFPFVLAFPSGPSTTTCATAPRPSSRRWRWPPARSPTPATNGTATRSSWTSSRRWPGPTPARSSTWSWTTTARTGTPTWRPARQAPRVRLHFTPTSGSWLNLVEVFFSIITRQAIRRGTFASVPDLIAAIRRFTDGWNERCHPFVWTKSPDEVLSHGRRRKRTSDARH